MIVNKITAISFNTFKNSLFFKPFKNFSKADNVLSTICSPGVSSTSGALTPGTTSTGVCITGNV